MKGTRPRTPTPPPSRAQKFTPAALAGSTAGTAWRDTALGCPSLSQCSARQTGAGTALGGALRCAAGRQGKVGGLRHAPCTQVSQDELQINFFPLCFVKTVLRSFPWLPQTLVGHAASGDLAGLQAAIEHFLCLGTRFSIWRIQSNPGKDLGDGRPLVSSEEIQPEPASS